MQEISKKRYTLFLQFLSEFACGNSKAPETTLQQRIDPTDAYGPAGHLLTALERSCLHVGVLVHLGKAHRESRLAHEVFR